jgi:hypothetical protein
LTIIAAAGSPFGMRGIATIPAPRRPRELVDRDDPVRADRAVDAVAAVAAVVAAAVVAVLGVEAAVRTEGAPAAGCAPAGAGALPQTSQ